jgi:hypothetical protein
MQDWKEVVGFLCRWCLLALAGAGMVLVAWMTDLASGSVAADLKAAMTVPDAVWGRQQGAHLFGITSPAIPRCSYELAMCGSAESELLFAPTVGRRIYPRLSVLRIGHNAVRIIGVPYSRHAFERDEALLQIVAPGRQVCLVDAAVAPGDGAADAAGFAESLRELQRRYDVAFFHNGSVEQFAGVRRYLRKEFPGIPLVFTVDDNLKSNTLPHAAWTLKKHEGEPGEPAVVTGDASLAVSACKSGFRVHLVGAAAVRDKRAYKLQVHESFAKFKEYLRVEPIRH